jgi:hypothetical protein
MVYFTTETQRRDSESIKSLRAISVLSVSVVVNSDLPLHATKFSYPSIRPKNIVQAQNPRV